MFGPPSRFPLLVRTATGSPCRPADCGAGEGGSSARPRSGHAIRPSCTPDRNEAPAKDRSRFEDTGKEFSFQFTPEAGKRFRLHVEVWGGFGEGNRDLHFHLGQRSRYRRYTLKLDLSRYLAAGCRLEPPPALYFHPQDPGNCDLCSQRQLAEAVAPARDGAETGVWEWELRNRLEGVVDVRWSLGAPAGEAARLRAGAKETV